MLTFTEAGHEYRYNGQRVPSVTQVLDATVVDLSMVDPDVLKAAQALGTAVHKVCEYHDLGTLDEASVHEKLQPYLQAYRKFLAECRPHWRLVERRVYHKAMGFAGTLDREGDLMGAAAILDIKSGIQHFAVGLQTSAYAEGLACEEPQRIRRRRFGLYLKDDGLYVLRDLDREETHDHDWRDFTCALGVYRLKQRHNQLKEPR